MSVADFLAVCCVIWYVAMTLAALLGFLCILSVFKKPPVPSHNIRSVEPVTIIRPVKGIDPELLLCIESSFLQNYPLDKVQILLCVYDANDPAIPTLQLLIAKYPDVDAEILVTPEGADHFGPNPKVNNLAKGFRAAKYDILWMMDSNVWALPNILANSVYAMSNNLNCGTRLNHRGRRVGLVHHVPLALSLDSAGQGALLDEMFLFSSHSKFYVSLNNLSIAPCVNGKSNIYRKSDLDYAVKQIPNAPCEFFHEQSVISDAERISSMGPGHSIGFFAKYIGEDNMIAIALWKYCFSRTALTGDLVIQPLISLADSTREYFNRRVRWLRVRKYMVRAATFIEPTTESIVCGIIGTLGLSRLFWARTFSSWYFVFHMLLWMAVDYVQYMVLVHHIDKTDKQPHWLRDKSARHRDFIDWCLIWFLRELFAFPIWVVAMVGHEIEWRGRPFRIKRDLSAEEL